MPLSVPFAGAAVVQVSVSPSTSVPESVRFSVPSSATVNEAAFAAGASFTGVMVMETVAVFESNVPSLALKVNESLPLAFAFGV